MPTIEGSADAAVPQRKPSGRGWCQQFLGSRSVDDLTPPFRDSVRAFLSALRQGGVDVAISATFRPPQRAFLMHWCYRIAVNGLDPAQAERRDDVPIDWVHRRPDGTVDRAASKAAADEMVTGYGLTVLPSLASRHIDARAIDMSITWTGSRTVNDGQGNPVTLPPMNAAGARAALDRIGRSYRVIPLPGDAVHWSDDGH
jgi:hypothetical protein